MLLLLLPLFSASWEVTLPLAFVTTNMLEFKNIIKGKKLKKRKLRQVGCILPKEPNELCGVFKRGTFSFSCQEVSFIFFFLGFH